MALYIPAGRRRRRLVATAVVAVAVGLVLGWLLGRATAPTVADRVGSVRSDAQALEARLQALPLEYEQQVSGEESMASGGSAADALTRIEADTRALSERAEWLSPTQRDQVVAAVAAASSAAAEHVPPAQFSTAIDEATTAVEQTFGLTPTAS